MFDGPPSPAGFGGGTKIPALPGQAVVRKPSFKALVASRPASQASGFARSDAEKEMPLRSARGDGKKKAAAN